MTKKLTVFLKNKHEEFEKTKLYRQEKIDNYIKNVNDLYNQLFEWTLDAKINSYLDIFRISRQEYEMEFGSYNVDVLHIEANDTSIIFNPQGIKILGYKARVDICFHKNVYKLVLTNDSKWHLHSKQVLELFTENLFLELCKLNI